MEHKNLERLWRGLRAFANRDLGELRELFTDDVMWHYGGTSVLCGEYVGFGEVFELFARRAALSEDTYAITVEHAIANDCFVTVLMRGTAKRGERTLDQTICYVYRVDGEKVVEAWGHPSDPTGEQAFYA